MGGRSIFALEVCSRLDETYLAGLRPMLANLPMCPKEGELWNLWSTAARELVARKAAWVSGCWDFWDDTAKAKKEFPGWVDALVKERGVRKAPSATGEPYRPGERFFTVTMACLLVTGSSSERAVSEACNIPDAYLWHRASFERILRGVPNINFAIVERATLYMIPRDDGWALTPQDLREDLFSYLRPIV